MDKRQQEKIRRKNLKADSAVFPVRLEQDLRHCPGCGGGKPGMKTKEEAQTIGNAFSKA